MRLYTLKSNLGADGIVEVQPVQNKKLSMTGKHLILNKIQHSKAVHICHGSSGTKRSDGLKNSDSDLSEVSRP